MASVDTEKFTAVSASLHNAFSFMNMSGLMNANQGPDIIAITENTNAAEDNPDQPEPGSKEYEEMLQGTIDELREELEEYRAQGQAAEAAEGDPTAMTEEDKIQMEIIKARQNKLNNFRKQINEEIDKMGIGGYVSMVDEDEKLVLRLASQILFASGSATLSAEGRDVMINLGSSFKDLDHNVDVQGHTDNVPISTAQFPSNWELSTQRATNVVRILQDDCGVPPARLSSTGFGEYQPIGDNSTPEGRQNNRRIDIVITTS
jgi:chemotaxis protein MotB